MSSTSSGLFKKMLPYQVTYQEWNEGFFFQKFLADEAKARLVDLEQVPPTPPDTGCTIYRAKLDGETVLAVVPRGEEPFDLESQRNLGWTKVIPTGRKKISEKQHRNYVEQALLLGKQIPLSVMGSYPELTVMEGIG